MARNGVAKERLASLSRTISILVDKPVGPLFELRQIKKPLPVKGEGLEGIMDNRFFPLYDSGQRQLKQLIFLVGS